MDRIQKFIRKLSSDEARKVLEAIANIRVGNISHLDVTKLGGKESAYRVRIGSIRIQFVKTTVGNIITKIGFKGDTTYR